jgi:hypothetical protein
METNFQRKGALSNAHAGREFEEATLLYFKETGVVLQRNFDVPVGFRTTKLKRFDLGSEDPPIIVECKSFAWTETGNSPSAKMHALNEVMLVFSAAPQRYRRILFVLKHMRKDVSLASHYLERFGHLIGPNVEIWEFDMDTDSRSGESSARRILKLLSPASASTQSGGFYCGLMSTVSSNLP